MLRRVLTMSAMLVVLISLKAGAAEATQPMVELRSDKAIWQGRIVDRSPNRVRLMDRSGRLSIIELSSVTSFRRLSAEFSPHNFNTIRTELLKEFGSGFEVATSRHYIVLASRNRAKTYVDVFEQTWRRLHMYFSVRGFELDDPEFPLIAIVLPDRTSFTDYARREGATIGPGILGYYWQTHNRVVMFEQNNPTAQRDLPFGESDSERLIAETLRGRRLSSSRAAADRLLQIERSGDRDWDWAFGSGNQRPLRVGLDGDLRETMIHEATHQLAYNLGLHNRTGDDPRWVVEGLATVFEAPGMESSSNSSHAPVSRTNHGWMTVFQRSAKDRPRGWLSDFVKDDSIFSRDLQNAYSRSWALSFWLIETRARQYAEFLKKTAADSRPMTPELRLEHFTSAFGENLSRMEVDLTRYYDKLAEAKR